MALLAPSLEMSPPLQYPGYVFITRIRHALASSTSLYLENNTLFTSDRNGWVRWPPPVDSSAFAIQFSACSTGPMETTLLVDVYINPFSMESLARQGLQIPGRNLLTLGVRDQGSRIIRRCDDALLAAYHRREQNVFEAYVQVADRLDGIPHTDLMEHQLGFASAARAHEVGTQMSVCDDLWPLTIGGTGILVSSNGSIQLPDEREPKKITLRNGILADDPGTGKTGCVLALVAEDGVMDWESELPLSQATLVVAPVSCIDVWASEARSRTPGLRVHKLFSRRDLDEVSWEDLCDPGLVILNSSLVQSLVSTGHYGARTTSAVHNRNSELKRCAHSPLGKPFMLGLSWRRVVIDEINSVKDQHIDILSLIRFRSKWILGDPYANERVTTKWLLDDGSTDSECYQMPTTHMSTAPALDTDVVEVLRMCVLRTNPPSLPTVAEDVQLMVMAAPERAEYERASTLEARVDACNLPRQGIRLNVRRVSSVEEAVEIVKATSSRANPLDIDMDCPICFDTMGVEAGMFMTTCGHVFCHQCSLRALVVSESRCPTCRSPVQGDVVQICGEVLASAGIGSKPELLKSLIQSYQSTGERCIVAVSSDLMGRRLADRLAPDVLLSLYAGNLVTRRAAVRNSSLNNRALILSQQCAADGADLSHASVIILMGNLSPTFEEHVVSRLRRVGQSKVVKIHRLIMRDTCEYDIFRNRAVTFVD